MALRQILASYKTTGHSGQLKSAQGNTTLDLLFLLIYVPQNIGDVLVSAS